MHVRILMHALLLLLFVACGEKKPASHDEVPAKKPASHDEVPAKPVTPALPDDAPAFVGCPYEVWSIEVLADGSFLVGPQGIIGSGAPQFGPPEQLLRPDGTVALAGTTLRPYRGRRWFIGDDGGSSCKSQHGTNELADCVDFELDPELAKLDGYGAGAFGRDGTYFAMSFTDNNVDPWVEFVAGFEGTGKRLATWKPARGCAEERPQIVLGHHVYSFCRREDGDNDTYKSWIVRDLRTGKQVSTIKGEFDDLLSAEIDDTHFVTYRPDLKAYEAYDMGTPAKPKRSWRAPVTLGESRLAATSDVVVAIERKQPWRGVILDAKTGAIRHEVTIDACRTQW